VHPDTAVPGAMQQSGPAGRTPLFPGQCSNRANRQSACFPPHSLLHLYPATEPPPIEICGFTALGARPTPPRCCAPHGVPSYSVLRLPPCRVHSSSRTSLTPAWSMSQTSLASRGTTMTTSSRHSSMRTSLAGTLPWHVEAPGCCSTLLRRCARAPRVPRPSSKVAFVQRMLQAYASSVSHISSGK
jgi:hypothetical protein